MTSMQDEISVVVCVKNGQNSIARTLQSARNQHVSEVIVVDGRSTDNTLRIAREFQAKTLSDEGKGLAYARQIGADSAKGDYVAFLDCDTELPEENVLVRMLEELKSRGWVATHAQLLDPRVGKTYWEEGEDFHFRKRHNIPGEREYLGTIVCLVKRDVVSNIKFDPFFSGAAEDGDFFRRVRRAGYRFGMSNLVAYHYHRASFKDFIRQRVWYGKGNANTMMKHRSYSLLLSPIGIFMYGVYLSLSNGKPRFVFFYFIWMISLLLGTVAGLLGHIFLRSNRAKRGLGGNAA